jgi:hypothetical protein
MSKSLILIVIIFLINSCSSIKNINNVESKRNSGSKINHDQVDLDINEHSTGTKVDVTPQEETVRVGDRGGDVYSNNPSSAETNHFEYKKLKIGLSFGPGLYRTLNYVSFLKVLERQNHVPEIVTGTGFGAIVAAMYSIGMTPEVIEWNFYKYFKEKKKNKLYEKDWLNEVDEKLLVKFKNQNIQDTKKKFYITLYDNITKKTYYFDKGNIRELLLLNLKLSNNLSESKNQKYSAAFENEVFNARLLKQLGAEFTVAVDVLGSSFQIESSSEFLNNVYQKIINKIKVEKKNFDYMVTLPLSMMNLDSTNEGPLYLQKSYVFMQKQSPLIQRKIQAKAESLIHLGNE